MAIGAGLAASVGIVTEATNGLAATPNHWLEFNNESIKGVKTIVQGKGLRGGGLFDRQSRRVVGSWGAKGAINFDAPFNGMGLWFEHMMGAFNPGAVGGTNNPLVQQQSATAAWLQTYAPASLAGKTFTTQVGRPDATGVVRPFTYVGCKVDSWGLMAEVNKYATMDVNVDAWQELTPDNPQSTIAGPALTAPTYTTGEQFFHFRQATIYNGGTLATAGGVTTLSSPVAAGRVSKVQLKVTNPLDTSRYFIAGTGGTGGSGVAGVKSEQLENNFRQIGGTLDVEFFSLASYYDVYYGDNPAALELIFTGPTAIASTFFPTLAILIPVVKYDGDTPVVAGPGILNQQLPFSGLDDETNNQIQVQYMSTDTAP